jgi:acetyl esterase/lipase
MTRVLVFVALALTVSAQAPSPTASEWTLDNLTRVGGHVATAIGEPRVVDTPVGRAIEFDGVDDGLIVEANPLDGLERFKIDVLVQPAPDGLEEQRFLHIEEPVTENRALMELRHVPGGAWAFDAYLKYGDAQLTLLDRARTHESNAWHIATLAFDGRTMSAYVDGQRDGSGAVAFHALKGGRTSVGVRQNKVSWFKGRVRSVRVTTGEDQAPEIPLWPEGVPGIKPSAAPELISEGRVSGVHVPTLTYYAPPPGSANGTAIIVCPGGSYARLAIANEADAVTGRLVASGVSVFVLKYRLSEYGYPAPLQDVLRAIRLLRSRSAEFGLRPDRIGVFGASAGGHLAAMAATLYDEADGRTGDGLDRVSARPDFVALLYPVVTMKPPFAHRDSVRNLLGERPAASLVNRLSVESAVTPSTPPMFLVHTADDQSVPLENSLLLYGALRKAGVPAELHLFDRGAHGFGAAQNLGTTSAWRDRLDDWLRARGLLTR